MAKREWILRRNCSISPRQLAAVYAALCVNSLMIATLFTVHGAWYIFGFAILEMFAVGLAFLHYARHAADRERIALIDDYLLVELVQAEQVRQIKLNPCCTQINLANAPRGLIGLEANGTRVEVGRFLTERKRREFAQELRSVLTFGG